MANGRDATVTGHIEFVTVLMCDDIRREYDGGLSLMGVATPYLEPDEFPVRRRVSFALIINTLSEGDVTFSTSLRWAGERRWTVEHGILIEASERGTIYPIDGTIAGFDKPGDLVFEVDYKGETIVLQTWSVEGTKSVGAD